MAKTLEIMTKNGITLEDIRMYALNQMERTDDDNLIGFMHDGQFVVNPWMDPTGRFDLTTNDAIDKYGKPNFIYFCETVSQYILALSSPASGKVIGTITAWGDDDYSVEWLELPEDVQEQLFNLTEPHCPSSVRGNADSIINDIREVLK